MSRALAIETSSRVGSIAVAQGPRVLAEEQFEHGLQHAAQIVPIIDRLCRGQGWGPRDLEQVYVSAGPGSFTGLRIGITLAKTMALATGVKLVAVPSVRVIVENAPAEARHVIVVLDAKRDQIFTARFERGGGGGDHEWIERESAQLASLTDMVARAPRPVHLLGEGIPFHEKFIPKDDGGVIVTDALLWRPRAGVVARLGLAKAASGQFVDPDRFVPIYIRKPEAEEKFDVLHAGKGRP
jgi:tRNA threonylcarbamoyladenosine biosynthesis protein TsaB